MTYSSKSNKIVSVMRKWVIKLTLTAFILMYAHQVFEHTGHVHGGDAMVVHRYQDSLFADGYCQYFESNHDNPVGHDHNEHQHLTEILPNKHNQKTLTKFVRIICFKSSSSVRFDNYSSHILKEGLGAKMKSSIPQYLRSQSFLI